MIYEQRSYRDYLRAYLLERKKTNKSYSLRGMAKHLGFSSSQLSEAMNGKANFSEDSLRKIAKKLKLNTKETEYLCLLGDYENKKDSEAREAALKKIQRLTHQKAPMLDLSIDQFVQMSDWYYSAILELFSLKDFHFTPANVASEIGISKIEATLAIERLLRLELLHKNDGQYSRAVSDFVVNSPEKNTALRKFYRQMFTKASTALDEQSPTERWSGYETFPVADEALPEIREACDRFFDEILKITNAYPNKKNVYHLSTHLFNLTNKREKK